ncbi:hypothetical protein KGV52_00190 [Candidatus Gracilibacteria bacterium]|nr:hypothetical protein [Candidatus Gracilibacteria bacterium]
MKKIILAIFLTCLIFQGTNASTNENKSCKIKYTSTETSYGKEVNEKLKKFVPCKPGEEIILRHTYGKNIFSFEYNGQIYINEKPTMKVLPMYVDKNLVEVHSSFSKYGNHYLVYTVFEGENMSESEIKKMQKSTGYFIDGVKVLNRVEIIKNKKGKTSYEWIYFPHSYEFNTTKFGKYLENMWIKSNETYFLSEKTLSKLNKAIDIFASKKENIAKIPTILKLAGKIQKKYKENTRNYEILDYLQAELKIIELKAKAKK